MRLGLALTSSSGSPYRLDTKMAPSAATCSRAHLPVHLTTNAHKSVLCRAISHLVICCAVVSQAYTCGRWYHIHRRSVVLDALFVYVALPMTPVTGIAWSRADIEYPMRSVGLVNEVHRTFGRCHGLIWRQRSLACLSWPRTHDSTPDPAHGRHVGNTRPTSGSRLPSGRSPRRFPTPESRLLP